jgi:hypothetical protein
MDPPDEGAKPKDHTDEDHINQIHKLMLRPLTLTPDADDKRIQNTSQLLARLKSKRHRALVFVCDGLGLAEDEARASNTTTLSEHLGKKKIQELAQLLVDWVSISFSSLI